LQAFSPLDGSAVSVGLRLSDRRAEQRAVPYGSMRSFRACGRPQCCVGRAWADVVFDVPITRLVGRWRVARLGRAGRLIVRGVAGPRPSSCSTSTRVSVTSRSITGDGVSQFARCWA
jgi:hypothetical protein